MQLRLPLPKIAMKMIQSGRELGDVTDELTGGHNEKQKGGIISYFTKGVVTRTGLYVEGLVMALVPFLNEELYF